MKKNATDDTHNKDNQYNEDRNDNVQREYNHGNDNLITLKKPISLHVNIRLISHENLLFHCKNTKLGAFM